MRAAGGTRREARPGREPGVDALGVGADQGAVLRRRLFEDAAGVCAQARARASACRGAPWQPRSVRDSSPAARRRARSIWKKRSCACSEPERTRHVLARRAEDGRTPSASRATVTGAVRPATCALAIELRQAPAQLDPDPGQRRARPRGAARAPAAPTSAGRGARRPALRRRPRSQGTLAIGVSGGGIVACEFPERWANAAAACRTLRVRQRSPARGRRRRPRSLPCDVPSRSSPAVLALLLHPHARPDLPRPSRGPSTFATSIAMDRLSEPAASPDGSTIVFTMSALDAEANRRRSDLWW